MSVWKRWVLVAAVFLAALAVFWVEMPARVSGTLSAASTLAALLFSLGTAVWTMRRARAAELRWRLLMAVWALIGAIGCAIPLVYLRFFGLSASWTAVSYSDLFFLVAPLPAGVALVLFPTSPLTPEDDGDAAEPAGKITPRSLVVVLDGLLITGSVFLIAWAAILKTVIVSGPPGMMQYIMAVLYPIIAMTLAVIVVLQATFRRPANPRALLLLGVGLAAQIITHGAWIRTISTGGRMLGPEYTAFAIVGIMLIALAVGVPRPDRRGDRGHRHHGVLTWAYVFLPYAPMAVAVVLVATLAVGGRLDSVEIAVSILLIVFVVVRQMIILTENTVLLSRVRRARQELHYQAFHDPLTGLANRLLFNRRLEDELAAQRGGAPSAHDERAPNHGEQRSLPPRQAAVLFCDLDKFKAVNDTLGHAAGDELLVAVARRLTGCVRDTDLVARLGGDEFAIVLAGDAEAPHHVADRVAEALRNPFVFHGRTEHVGVSIGMATIRADTRPDDADELLRRADAAMYVAKRRTDGQVVIFHPDTGPADLSASPFDGAALRPTHQDGPADFRVDYEPIVALADHRIVAFEAFPSWSSTPDTATATRAAAGRSGPDQTGDAGAVLDGYVLTAICADLPALRNRFGAEVAVHIDIAPPRLGGPWLVERVVADLRRRAVPPPALVIEISGTTTGPDLDAAARALSELSRCGVRIALDNIGADSSGFAGLRRLPVDIIKVDQALTLDAATNTGQTQIGPTSLIIGLVRLADTLKATVIARGLANQHQADIAKAAGCHCGQGPYFGPSIAVHHLAEVTTTR
ncbi:MULTISPECIES: bifunctional diguanylate cyclase/phosphodiesterase [unclassified Pseudofrankia]|uniref:putative bifunctional diguanylate cyclase/phosphodiesterase n=1 Tax=unclassified Pseudofrankia TaxID=2994372 RepID=UPI0008D96AD6|nr:MULTISPECIES: diguanylate cyclase [unclassified Pseudofrankia]MDT3439290.1 diguanylate cyclase [Pseudofrankia sp. BMG5.37]OHV73971.1 hypothetical protein BCD48_32745 [Pseudofrankia sp. BMG5.36]